jgi:hypothetical protein
MSITQNTGRRKRDRTAEAIAAMCVGLLLTGAATVAPFVDRATGHVLANHIHDGYPTYTAQRVDEAVTTWITVLTFIGVLGVTGWLTTIWAVATHRPWARPTAIALLLIGTGLALASLLTKDSSGEIGFVPMLGGIGLAPSVPGLMTVALLSAGDHDRGRTRGWPSATAAGDRHGPVAPQRRWNT